MIYTKYIHVLQYIQNNNYIKHCIRLQHLTNTNQTQCHLLFHQFSLGIQKRPARSFQQPAPVQLPCCHLQLRQPVSFPLTSAFFCLNSAACSANQLVTVPPEAYISNIDTINNVNCVGNLVTQDYLLAFSYTHFQNQNNVWSYCACASCSFPLSIFQNKTRDLSCRDFFLLSPDMF